jgi:glycerol kinase
MNTGGEFCASRNRMLTAIAYRLGGKVTYAVEGAIFVAGATIQWMRDGLGIIKSAQETEKLAASVADNGGVYMVPAFTGLGAPYWDPRARGALVGLTRATTAAHVVRAGLEAQAYQTEDLMMAMAEDAGRDIAEIRVDGGMARNNWVCQFLSDITNKPVLRPKVIETTVLGAAYLAGLQAGMFKSIDDIASTWTCERVFRPEMKKAERDALISGWRKAVAQVLVEPGV